MLSLNTVVRRMIELRKDDVRLTLLAVCPNSDAVLEAAIQCAQASESPMLFAATLNQVDRDGGYTGWTPSAFVERMKGLARKHNCTVPLYACLDHGGPWLKDANAYNDLPLDETMAQVKASIAACLDAEYALLHVDPTVDRTLPAGQPPAIEQVIERTVDLMAYTEVERERRRRDPVAYEVGTEEVRGGLADFESFSRFMDGLQRRLSEMHLSSAWPCFVVGKVGTDLHTTTFDAEVARRLDARIAPLGSLVKGHYTDWVANPQAYPRSGMGGANVGPELTATELEALKQLCRWEEVRAPQAVSRFERVLEVAVAESRRWRKWLLEGEEAASLGELSGERRGWLVATGARYVWTDPRVQGARQALYDNLRSEMEDPHTWVVNRIAENIEKYIVAFNLRGSVELLGMRSPASGADSSGKIGMLSR
jgi:D-tagatose-1,6-bisphosphate aldolase subunit GatZ/KbaZ